MCVPPDTCSLAGGDCPEGHACAIEPWGETYCRTTEGLSADESCSLGTVACADGYACLDDGAGAVCRKLCVTAQNCDRDGAQCERFVGEGVPFPVGVCAGGCADDDGDGVCNTDDCAPDAPHIYPGASEMCETSEDEDCDGKIDEGCDVCVDEDEDGVCADSDCDDTDASVYPNAAETCVNGLDDDCDEQIDEGCAPAGGEPSQGGMDISSSSMDTDPEKGMNTVDAGLEIKIKQNREEGASSGCSATGFDGPQSGLWWLFLTLLACARPREKKAAAVFRLHPGLCALALLFLSNCVDSNPRLEENAGGEMTGAMTSGGQQAQMGESPISAG